MEKATPEQEEPKGERRFSQEQYDMLLRCSRIKDTSEWNQWRQENPVTNILLAGVELRGQNLKGAVLNHADLQDSKLAHANLEGTDLRFGNLNRSDLEHANLKRANLAASRLEQANLQRADLTTARLDGASLAGARAVTAGFARASLSGANMRGADLRGSDLQGAWAPEADLRSAILRNADLRAAEFSNARFEGAECQKVVVDGSTCLWGASVDLETDFHGVGLASVRVEPGTRQFLEYSIRRRNWQAWYGRQPLLKSRAVACFWWMSDYGLSTGRIIAVFFGLAVFFAAIYCIWGLFATPGIVQNLLVDRNGVEVPSALVPFRALYFSVVTMTTLGFGDMHAYAASFWGHLLLMVQVLLGYVLLAALVTRFAILFTAGGPAGKFSKPEKQPNRRDRGESK